ncbi:MAG: GEVED domain-containing protein [Anaerolineae bacterium]
MLKRLLVALTSLSLLLGAAVLVWQANPATALGQPRAPFTLYAPLIAKEAFPNGSASSIQLGITTSVASNGNITYRIRITNLADKGVTVLPLEFGYDPSVLKFLSATHTPDSPTPGALRWNNLAAFSDIGPLGPAGSATASKTFDITMGTVVCPQGGIVTVNVLVSGAIDSANQVIAPAQVSNGQQVCTPLQIAKSLFNLPTGQALVGDLVTFDLLVTNPASNSTAPPALQNVTGPIVIDRFNPDILHFKAASIELQPGSFTPISATTPITGTPVGTVTFQEALANTTLTPGQSLRLHVQFEVRACGSALGTTNVGEVAVIGATGLPVRVGSSSANLVVICPNIQVTKRIQAPAQGVVAVNENITFTIAVQAVGNQAINVVPMEDIFDPNILQYVSADPAPSGVPIGGNVSWDDLLKTRGASLQPGETYTVTLLMKAVGCPVGGQTANRARVGNGIASGGGYGFGVPQSSDTVAVDVACPRVNVEKRLITPRSGLIQELGSDATYEVVVRNTGNLPLVTVPLTDTFNASIFDLISTSIPPSTNSGGKLTWTNLAVGAPLAPGQSIAMLMVLRNKACPPINQITYANSAGVTGALASFRNGTLPVPPSYSSANVDVVCAQVKLTKTLLSPPDRVVSPNVAGRSTLTFRIDITNTGNITVTRLPLVDSWDPAYLDFLRVGPNDPSPDEIISGGLTWDNLATPVSPPGPGLPPPPNTGPLLPGQHRTITVLLRPIGCPPNQTVFNEAIVDNALAIAQGAGVPTPLPKITAFSDARIACPAVEVEKRVLTEPNCDIVGINQNVTFEVIVRNTGNSTLTTIPLTDTYEANYLQFLSADPAPNSNTTSGSGQTATGLISWANVAGAAPNGFGRGLPPGESFSVKVTFKTLRSTGDIQRAPARYTLNRAGITGATDEYGFTAKPAMSAPARLRIAQADLYIEMTQETQYPTVQVNGAVTDTFGMAPWPPQMSNQVVVPGELITYTIKYGNRGPYDEAPFVRIQDIIPAGTIYVGHSQGACVNSDIQNGCFIGSLIPGQNGQFKVTIRVPNLSESTDGKIKPGVTLVNTITIASGFSPSGPQCGVPDYFASDNTATWSTDILSDFGDSPAVAQPPLPGYGTGSTGTYNGNYIHEWLGRAVSGERSVSDAKDPDGEPNVTATTFNGDHQDDGVYFRNPWDTSLPQTQRVYRPGELAVTAKVIVSARDPMSGRYGADPSKQIYIQAWADNNRNGVFGDVGDMLIFQWHGYPGSTDDYGNIWPGDKNNALLNIPIRVPGETGWIIVRVRLSYGTWPTPNGSLDYGETEDYLIGTFPGYDWDNYLPIPGLPQPRPAYPAGLTQ